MERRSVSVERRRCLRQFTPPGNSGIVSAMFVWCSERRPSGLNPAGESSELGDRLYCEHQIHFSMEMIVVLWLMDSIKELWKIIESHHRFSVWL
jgi:hypothetical protein